MDFGERDITITLKGREWFALAAKLNGKELSSIGREYLLAGIKKLAKQLGDEAGA